MALAAAPPALAGGGDGGLQAVEQAAKTAQAAVANATSEQNAVNANVPVTIAGNNATSGPSSASQEADSTAVATATNEAATNQVADLGQNVGGSGSCQAGCGGSGGYQAASQDAKTGQVAAANADSDQQAVNANVPVTIAGNDATSGPSSASQDADSTAVATANNAAETNQVANLEQNGGGSGSCQAGCGGSGGYQAAGQNAHTGQVAAANADSDQQAVNANVPVTIAGNDATSGRSSATQDADSTAVATASNAAETNQVANLEQDVGGRVWCKHKCRPVEKPKPDYGDNKGKYDDGQKSQSGYGQKGKSDYGQKSQSGYGQKGKSDYAYEKGKSDYGHEKGKSDYEKGKSDYGHEKGKSDYEGHDGCKAGCGGNGGFQALSQNAWTGQLAVGNAESNQQAVNANVPVTIAGNDATSGPSSATQNADSTAVGTASNTAETNQVANLVQSLGGYVWCKQACIPVEKEQCKPECVPVEKERCKPACVSVEKKKPSCREEKCGPEEGERGGYGSWKQNGGYHEKQKPSCPKQECRPEKGEHGGYGKPESDCRDRCKPDYDRHKGCKTACGGHGGKQAIGQQAWTGQLAVANAESNQRAVNANVPVTIAGNDATSGSSSATQDADSTAVATASNAAETNQLANLEQGLGGESLGQSYGEKCRCESDGKRDKCEQNDHRKCKQYKGHYGCNTGCGGHGGFAVIGQSAKTLQLALANAASNQQAVNTNRPVTIAGNDANAGESTATQDADSTALATARNQAATNQLANLGEAMAGGDD
ncbi:MAG: hypothetical protein M3322_04500 [Actinomycetota bacterium]|nr:hypothetical protein [Actinomycetota bacterium]